MDLDALDREVTGLILSRQKCLIGRDELEKTAKRLRDMADLLTVTVNRELQPNAIRRTVFSMRTDVAQVPKPHDEFIVPRMTSQKRNKLVYLYRKVKGDWLCAREISERTGIELGSLYFSYLKQPWFEKDTSGIIYKYRATEFMVKFVVEQEAV